VTTQPAEDTRVAVVVDPAQGGPGLLGNTIATIAIGLGAAAPQLGGPQLVDRAGYAVQPSATVPVPVLQADPDVLRELLARALQGDQGRIVVAFPGFARSMHDFPAYQLEFARRDLATEDLHGVGLAGPRKWVASLTGSLRLLR